jgi:hypothetical protein
MCFRLLAAIPGISQQTVQSLAIHEGLDVRGGPAGELLLMELAWGDCACSLYTRKDGRERVVSLVGKLLKQAAQVQLLLFTDGEELNWGASSPVALPFEKFSNEGLAALEEGRVHQLTA